MVYCFAKRHGNVSTNNSRVRRPWRSQRVPRVLHRRVDVRVPMATPCRCLPHPRVSTLPCTVHGATEVLQDITRTQTRWLAEKQSAWCSCVGLSDALAILRSPTQRAYRLPISSCLCSEPLESCDGPLCSQLAQLAGSGAWSWFSQVAPYHLECIHSHMHPPDCPEMTMPMAKSCLIHWMVILIALLHDVQPN
jgi:hypothetical protein